MTLLVANGFGLYALATSEESSPLWRICRRATMERVAFHFEHPEEWVSNFPFGPGGTNDANDASAGDESFHGDGGAEAQPLAPEPAIGEPLNGPPADPVPGQERTESADDPGDFSLSGEVPTPGAAVGGPDREEASDGAADPDDPTKAASFSGGDKAKPSMWTRGAVSLWDLIQPSFMFMVGVAMPFSDARRRTLGDSASKRWRHTVLRALILVLLGVFCYSVDSPQTNWIFPNVLAQIGLGYGFAYLVLNWKPWAQIVAVGVILLGTWYAFYQYTPPEGHDFAAVNASAERGEILAPPFAQWSKNGNVAHAADLWLLNKLPRPADDPFMKNGGGYQTLNFVPSIATTILGILCGQLLLSGVQSPWRKVGMIVLGGAACYVLGLAAGGWMCPIIKRIWTPSWVLFSGAYVLWLLALFYVAFDIFPFKRLAFPLVVIGVNSIAIYLVGELGVAAWIREHAVRVHARLPMEGLLEYVARWTGTAEQLASDGGAAGPVLYTAFAPVIENSLMFLVLWLIAWAMYRRRLLLRI